jgi:monovalent cation:H+ antiporter-2, CPA2 family
MLCRPGAFVIGVLAGRSDMGKALVVLIPLILLATRWVPSLMIRIACMRNPELYVLVVLALGLTIAAITQTLGLSLALGAFLSGMIVSGTEVAHETLQRLQSCAMLLWRFSL